jgi:hypothetical protein
MLKIEALQKKRPLKVLFCYSNSSIVKGYVNYFNGPGIADFQGEKGERVFEMYGTTSLYRVKTWLAFCNISGITGGVRRKYLNDEKFSPLKTPYPFDAMVIEYTDTPGENGLTTVKLLQDINALGLLNGFFIEREGKQSFRPPLTVVGVIDPLSKNRQLENLMKRGVREAIEKPLDIEVMRRAIFEAYNEVNAGTRAHLKDGDQIEYDRVDGSKEALTIVSKSFQIPGNEVDIDMTFQEGSFNILRGLI